MRWSTLQEVRTRRALRHISSELCLPQQGLSADLSDGLHLTAEGYAVVFDRLSEVIVSKWPDLEPEKMRMPMPQ